MVDVFTRYVRARAIPDEKAETIATVLIDDWVSIFGPMEWLLSDGGTKLVSDVIRELTAMLGIGRLQTYPFHPQANGTVERWNRTLGRDLFSFMATGLEDWDEHVAIVSFRYNTGVCEATGMTPYKAMFGVEAFTAWEEVDRACLEEEPTSLATRLGPATPAAAGKIRRLTSKGKKAVR